MLSSGRAFGPYRIVSELGAGGMGEVYLAEDTRLERKVALKVLPWAAADDEASRKRLIREARLAATLDHPNICTVYEVGEADGHAFIAMQYVEGQTLAARLQGRPLQLSATLAIAAQMAAALAEAHRRGIVHRDVKPQNVMLTAGNHVKVLDFGLAKATAAIEHDARTGTIITQAGAIAGTIPYMSPEQIRGEPLDARSDVFAVGCVLHEMIGGAHPFLHPNAADTMSAILSRDPEPLPATTSSEIQRVVRKCLEKDRERRYQSMREVALDLEQAGAESALPTPARGWRGRRGWLATAAILLIGGLAGGYLYLHTATPARVSADDFVQITGMDAATAPALSPDGRMIAFMRGEDFLGTGQIYVKLLPNGDPVQLTNDPRPKYAPTFTPDASRVAYTTIDRQMTSASWDTWTVPVLGGPTVRMLPNAAGLTWIDDRHVLFSEIEPGTGLHMGIVTAGVDRQDERRIYFPAEQRAMAHYSYLSPDRRQVLVVEMDRTGTFQQCRVVPFDGSSAGQRIGPAGACMAAAWSPDGRWMYFSAEVNGSSHLWRQRSGGGVPEPITSAPATEERGVALAPDGRSLVTFVGRSPGVLWIHEAGRERSVPLDGSVGSPHMSRDGTRAYCLIQRVGEPAAFGVTQVTLASGKTERMLTDFAILDFDISRDEQLAAFTTLGEGQRHEIWMAALDRSSPPRRVAMDGDQVRFGRGELVYRSLTGTINVVMRAGTDGGAAVRVSDQPVIELGDVSLDGEWVLVRGPSAGESAPGTLLVPVHGGAPKEVCATYCPFIWSLDGRAVYQIVTDASGARRLRTLPIAPGAALPDIDAISRLETGTTFQLPGDTVSIGPDPSVFVFTRREQHGNLFRVPLR